MKIAALGDTHTAGALRLAGIEAFVADSSTAGALLSELLSRQDTGLIIVTRDLAGHLPPELRRRELERALPVVVAIPGIDDARGLSDTALAGIARTLGLPLQETRDHAAG